MAKVRGTIAGAIVQSLVRFFSGEWILEWSPHTANGGTVVAARSVWLAGWIYLAAFLVYTRFAAGKGSVIDWRQGAADIVATLPWLAATLGGVYAALYSRFSSQWEYLAGLFNQIVGTMAQMEDPLDERRLNLIAAWKAGFIEDAQDLHLAAKPMFLMAVLQWGAEELVKENFVSNTVGGERRLIELLARLQQIRDEVEERLPTSARTRVI